MRLRDALVISTLFLAAACGSSEGSNTDAGGSTNPEAETDAKNSHPEAEAQEKSPNCERVSKAMSRAIASGEESGAGLKPVKAAAVKSDDFEEVHFVAIELEIAGVDNQVGVWATNSLKPGGGVIMAVDGIAQQFTV